MLPTLSQIRAWDTEHLILAANHWSQTADQWEDAFLTMRNQSHSIVWQGAGGEGLRQRTRADQPVVSSTADQLRDATAAARDGAGTISAAQHRVMYAVEDAHNAGFNVGEDLSVTDTRTNRTAAERAARQAQGETLAADIRQRAAQLVLAEQTVAHKITAAAAGVGTTTFPETPTAAKPASDGAPAPVSADGPRTGAADPGLVTSGAGFGAALTELPTKAGAAAVSSGTSTLGASMGQGAQIVQAAAVVVHPPRPNPPQPSERTHLPDPGEAKHMDVPPPPPPADIHPVHHPPHPHDVPHPVKVPQVHQVPPPAAPLPPSHSQAGPNMPGIGGPSLGGTGIGAPSMPALPSIQPGGGPSLGHPVMPLPDMTPPSPPHAAPVQPAPLPTEAMPSQPPPPAAPVHSAPPPPEVAPPPPHDAPPVQSEPPPAAHAAQPPAAPSPPAPPPPAHPQPMTTHVGKPAQVTPAPCLSPSDM